MHKWLNCTKVVQLFRQYDYDELDTPITWYQAATNFAAWVSYYSEVNRRVCCIYVPKRLRFKPASQPTRIRNLE